MRRRAILYAALALAVPLPALALTGEGGPAPEQSLTVSASLDSCGTASDTIVCKIDATWNQIAGADRYSATVTRADGSVVDFGDVGAGGASFWVPYVGNGTYTVTVSAYGTPPGEEDAAVVAKGSASAGSSADEGSGAGSPGIDPPGPAGPGELDAGDVGETGTPGPDDGTVPPEEEPACEEEPVETAEDPEGAAPAVTGDGESAALSAEAESALGEEAEVPEAVECPEPAEIPAG